MEEIGCNAFPAGMFDVYAPDGSTHLQDEIHMVGRVRYSRHDRGYSRNTRRQMAPLRRSTTAGLKGRDGK